MRARRRNKCAQAVCGVLNMSHGSHGKKKREREKDGGKDSYKRNMSLLIRFSI